MLETRREFLVGCSAAIAAMTGGQIGKLVFAQSAVDLTERDILVVCFLRGGCDALSLIAPTNDPNYTTLRPSLRVSDTGDKRALFLSQTNAPSVGFGLHPEAAPLKELYDSGDLAIVHACGLTNGTRSHFDAMDYIERGTPNDKQTASGWIARHLQSVHPTGQLPSAAATTQLPVSLLSSDESVVVGYSLEDFQLASGSRYGPIQQHILEQLYQEDISMLHQTGVQTLDAMRLIESNLPKDAYGFIDPYEPEEGAEYTGSTLSRSLMTIAQLIKFDIGLEVATVDYGGWDTHSGQSLVFPTRVWELSHNLLAFYNDLSRYHSRLTVVVMSEFGRRLRQNNSGGTDHGHGGMMLVLGRNVRGGRMYGRWPGLEPEHLDRGVDLQVTTDFRTVLSEILVRRLGNSQLSTVFPGLTTYQPLNICAGTDLPVELAPPE